MHWPVAFGRDPEGKIVKTPKDANGKVILNKKLTEDPLPTWQAMERLVDSGKVKSIGVSNFNIRRLEALMKGVSIGCYKYSDTSAQAYARTCILTGSYQARLQSSGAELQ